MEKYIDSEIMPIPSNEKLEMAKYQISASYLLLDYHAEPDTIFVGKIVRNRINGLIHKDWIYKWRNI